MKSLEFGYGENDFPHATVRELNLDISIPSSMMAILILGAGDLIFFTKVLNLPIAAIQGSSLLIVRVVYFVRIYAYSFLISSAPMKSVA